MLMILPLKPIGPIAVPVPAYATPGSAGLDLCAAISAPVTIMPGERKLIPTGLTMAIPAGYEGQIRARSGLALKYGIGMVNGVGTIDSDYRGELGLLLVNHGHEPFVVEPLMRCGQLVIAPVVQLRVEVVEELDATVRGAGGYGSTGINNPLAELMKEKMGQQGLEWSPEVLAVLKKEMGPS